MRWDSTLHSACSMAYGGKGKTMARKKKVEKLPYSGFFLTFERGRIEKLREMLHYPGEASESFSAMDWEFEKRELALLCLSSGEATIDAVVLMDRMHGSGGTGKLMMRIWSPLIFDSPIAPAEVADAFSVTESRCTAATFKRIHHEQWPQTIAAIKRQRPDLADRLDALLKMRDQKNKLAGNGAKILRLTEQRDAVGLALDIASLDRKTVFRDAHLDGLDGAQTVLDLLDHEPLQEQDAIRMDQKAFEGLLILEDVRSARFSGPAGREVRVHVYDKKPLETVLGIDLLIYLADYNSYLLLQYKCMEPKSDKQGKTWSYLVNSQLLKQIEAMDTAVAAISQVLPPTVPSLKEWRLSDEAFFFKFCETTRPDARDDALIAGITLGHSHLKRFLALPESSGGNGGQRVGYSNCPRYLNNTQFVDLAREGWIGCDQRGYKFISQVIAAGQVGGRVAMYAVIEGSGAKTAAERRKRIR